MEADRDELKKYGPIDAYFDIGPPEAAKSTHIMSCMLALRHGARVSLMGGYRESTFITTNLHSSSIPMLTSISDIPIPHSVIMHGNIRIFGKWMYERQDIYDMLKLVGNGLLDLGVGKIVGEYPLEQWKEAWDAAADNAGFAQQVLIKP
jgi:threonine dehydrogenase-like Zn-dependent dehydrogenase